MAEETVVNGELSDAKNVEITGDEASLKFTELNQRITVLERENEGYKQEIGHWKATATALSSEYSELEKKVLAAETECKALSSVASRAADLEGEVSRLQHDLVSTMSDLEETNVELSNTKKELAGVKQSEEAKGVELEAVAKERDLLFTKAEKLKQMENNLRKEAERKEEENLNLKKNIEELEAIVRKSKGLEESKYDLEKVVEKMKEEIFSLKSSLKEKDKIIGEFDVKDRAIEDKNKGSVGGVKQKDWVVVGGATIAAVAVMGVACYMHAARKK